MPRTLADLRWPLHTERLLIRRGTADDVDATLRYRRLATVARWLPSHPRSREDYAPVFTEPARLACTLIVELPGPGEATVIGDLKLAVEDAWTQSEVSAAGRGVQAEVGWALDPSHGGRGYATEAVTESLRICFDELGLRRVVAYCFADNEPSWRLMERVGMRREAHTMADALHRSGEWLDGFVYAVLADEWRARAARSAAG